VTLWLKWLLIGLGAGLVLGLFLARGRPVDPVVLHRVDSILVTGPAEAALRDSVTRVANRANQRATMARSEAARLRRVADSMAQSANLSAIERPIDTVTPDTAPTSMVSQSAYDTLAAAYDRLTDAYAQQGQALALLMTQADRDSARIGSLERVLGEARAELVKTKKPSRWGLGCAAGYGASVSAGVVHASPAIACGVTFRIR